MTKEEMIDKIKQQTKANDFEVELIVERALLGCQTYVNNSNYNVLDKAPFEVIALCLHLFDSMTAKASVEKGISSISQSSRSVSFFTSKDLDVEMKNYIKSSLSLPCFAGGW